MSECEYCANYYKCENTVPTDCFEEIRSIYDVLGNGLVFKTTDLDETCRARMNFFFKSNYGFEFKDPNGGTFDIQLNDAIMKTKKTHDIIVEMARKVFRTKTSPAQHRHINWVCFNLIDIEHDVTVSEEQVKATFFKFSKCDGIITQIDCEDDGDGEFTFYVYIENGDPDNYLQETFDWGHKLTENGFENGLSDEYYEGYDVVIIYGVCFE